MEDNQNNDFTIHDNSNENTENKEDSILGSVDESQVKTQSSSLGEDTEKKDKIRNDLIKKPIIPPEHIEKLLEYFVLFKNYLIVFLTKSKIFVINFFLFVKDLLVLILDDLYFCTWLNVVISVFLFCSVKTSSIWINTAFCLLCLISFNNGIKIIKALDSKYSTHTKVKKIIDRFTNI